MRFVANPTPLGLPATWAATCNRRVAAVNAFAIHKDRSTYIKAHGSWTLLKVWLIEFCGEKCWYCESKTDRAPLDVDHFRPKLGVTVDNVALDGHAGYYWLAYEWSNFRLACQRCNRPENSECDILHGKANEFPILDETTRCQTSAAPLTAESPRLLDPCVEMDCTLLAHGINGEVGPSAARGTWEFDRARYTIDRLGFNEWNTPEEKRGRWRLLELVIRLAGNRPDVIECLEEYLAPDHEYSSFFRSVIGTHRDKEWVENLL